MARHHSRDIGQEIDRALVDPVLGQAMSRAVKTMQERRSAAWPSAVRFEELRTLAASIKDDAIAMQDELVATFTRQAEAAGAVVVHARDGEAARAYVCGLARERGIDRAVKSKSMTSEEISLNPALEKLGVSVIEGDLGERIIQLADERPSHLVVPAIHKTKEEIVRLFTEKMALADPPDDAEGLTRLVREDLRHHFLGAGMGITGANFAIAETGSIVIVENEGNASLTTLLPPIHVAIVGREKIIPRMADLGVFLELLPKSATGQKMTSYVSILTGLQHSPVLTHSPAPEREFHLIILDNGRKQASTDPQLREALRCLRCGACLNVCAPYSVVGGQVYGGDPYPGGIGCVWTYMTKSHAAAWDFNGLCTTCSRCTEVCPVKIDIPWLNTVIRERTNGEFGAGLRQRVFARADLMGKVASPVAPIANAAMRTAPVRASLDLLGIDSSRKMPDYARETFRGWWSRHEAMRPEVTWDHAIERQEFTPSNRAALFVDCWMNHNLPQVGRAAVQLLERAQIELVVAHNSCCGRPAMSQGLLRKPRQWARKNAEELTGLVDQGYDLVFFEPSCLSAIRDDCQRLLEDGQNEDVARFRLLEHRCYDISEYLLLLARDGRLPLEFRALAETFVVHGHCHLKSLGLGALPAELLRLIPDATVHEVDALCCGMVGSFGYKKEYSPLSRAMGARLFERLNEHDGCLVACGISCRSQMNMGTGRSVVHPVEVLAWALEPDRGTAIRG